MSRRTYYKSKRGHRKWNKNQYIDDRNDDGSGDNLRMINTGFNRRDHGGTGRRSISSEMVRRAMNLLPMQPDGSPGAMNSGLGIGEAWSRITVVFGATRPLTAIHEMVNTAFGTQLRFYNSIVENNNTVMYAKIRQKQLSSYRKSIQNLRDMTGNKALVGDITLVPEPRVPSAPSKMSNGSHELSTLLPDTWLDALRRCFLERFQPTTRSLDLSSLHTDPSLLSQGLYLPLNRTVVVHALVNILKQNGAQLSLLSLANNRLTHTNAFSPLATTPNDSSSVTIERVDLSGNPLNGFPSLAGLRGINGLTELDISDTPLATRFQQNDRNLASNIAKVLPTLKRLNGTDLPQTIQFAIEQAAPQSSSPRITLPAATSGYFPNDEMRHPLLCFLKEYFERYDTNPRGENLLPYYTSASQLVMSVTRDSAGLPHHNPHGSLTARLETVAANGATENVILTTARFSPAHLQKSRNQLVVNRDTRRMELVAHGSLACASLLGDLPPTEHILESFTIDVAYHSDSQMVFTIAGVFYEIHPLSSNSANSKSASTVRKILRSFSRTMIIVAPGGQIVQDDLIISNPSMSLCKKYITNVAAKSKKPQSTADAPVNPPQAPGAPSLPVTMLDLNNQTMLVNQLRQVSGMNEAFSRQCLEEYQWNYDAALASFQTLRSAGKLPPEAF